MSAVRERVAHGSGRAVELAAGETLSVSTPDGAQGGDLSFAGFDQALTRNINGWERFGRPWLVFSAEPGMALYDGDGEAALRVVESAGEGSNDIMYPGCWSELYEDGRPGCRDLIAAALGLERRELTGMLSFFVGASADSTAYRGLEGVSLRPGDRIVLEALREVRVAVSACPDTEIPGWRAGELEVQVNSG